MSQLKRILVGVIVALFAILASPAVKSADVSSYSILKGHFLNQHGPDTLVLDPDLGFCVLAFVEMTDLDVVTNATLRFPDGSLVPMEDYGDSIGIMDNYEALADMNANWQYGDYTMSFSTLNEGSFSCTLTMPNTALPPIPRLTNFDAVQSMDPSVPLVLTWDYSTLPKSNDFVQVYINLGHGEVFSTPNLGEPGALNAASRTVTVPANVMEPGYTYSLNIEITRMLSTNSTSYPEVQGVAGMFRSTSIDFTPSWPPLLVLPAAPSGSALLINVLADAGKSVVLQTSEDLYRWTDYATNVSETITNLFTIPKSTNSTLFFRARQQ